MQRAILLVSVLIGVALLALRAGAPPAEVTVTPEDGVLALDRLHYREDDGRGRIVSEVTARIVRGDDSRVELELTSSAVGPLVDPVLGLSGVRGGNVHTAREHARLLAQDVVEIRTWRAEGGEPVPGRARIGREGRVAERRRLADGRIDYTAESGVLPLELVLSSGPLGDGDWRTEVLVAGRPRLAVDFAVENGRGTIVRVTERAAHAPEEGKP